VPRRRGTSELLIRTHSQPYPRAMPHVHTSHMDPLVLARATGGGMALPKMGHTYLATPFHVLSIHVLQRVQFSISAIACLIAEHPTNMKLASRSMQMQSRRLLH
jgi:hypothetical protein